jgi:hypothetical protein
MGRKMDAGNCFVKKFTRSFFLGGAAVLCVAGSLTSQVRADTFVISGDSANFAVLYEGTGSHQLQTNNSNINGNIGIGGTGKFSPAGGCVGNCVINGTVDFSAAQTSPSQYGTTPAPPSPAGPALATRMYQLISPT